MKKILTGLTYAVGAALMIGSLFAPSQGQPPKADQHGRGHVTPKNINELHAASWEKHGKRLQALPTVMTPAYDCRMLGIVGPVQDQGSCGSCWNVSECGVIDSAFIQAGYFKPDGSLTVSAQFIMDCTSNGGCGGDDASTVAIWAKDHGIPSTQDYGPYRATTGNCKALPPGTKLWKIDSYGYCAQFSGIAPVQSIKDAIVRYGPISSAVDAGGFNSYTNGIMNGDGSNVDHDVSIIGWNDNMGPGCWLVKNQWRKTWGENGYCWIPYNRWSIGTSAMWAHATPIQPPTPVPPPGPVVPSYSFTIPATVIPGQTITIPGNFFRGNITIKTAPYTVPAQTITFPK